MERLKLHLAWLWLFATLNYLYCDVVTLMNPELLRQFLGGRVGGLDITPGFLLGSSVLVEIPIAMVVAARVLDGRAHRWANIAAGVIMTLVQSASLVVQSPPPYYVFFSAFEIAATAAIVWLAWTRRLDDHELAEQPVELLPLGG